MAKSDEPRLGDNEIKNQPNPLVRRWLWSGALLLLMAGIAWHLWKGQTISESGLEVEGAGSGGGRHGGGGQMANRVMPVGTATAKRGDIRIFENDPGNVTPLATVTVKSRVDGELMGVAFQEGQLVQQGDVLAEVDPRPYQAALLQAQGQLERDTAALTNAQLDLARDATLLKGKATTQQVYDTQAAVVQQNEGTVQADKGTVQNAELQLTYSHITAPVGGRVGLRQVDAGNIIHASDANGLAVITQLQPISVVFTMPEDSLPAVQKQLAAGNKLSVEAYDRTFTTKLAAGTLLTLDNQIDPSTGTLKLKAIFPNDDQRLFPNQFVNVRLLVETRHDLIVVPTAAIQQGTQNAKFVYVVKPDETVTVQNVTVGPSEGDVTSIAEGLSEGQVVVIDGADKLREGGKVQVSAPAVGGPASGAPAGSASPHHRRSAGAAAPR